MEAFLAQHFAHVPADHRAPYGLDEGTLALVALAAFVGHLWPVFFHFKGGKGVATALGVLLALNVWLGLATLATWIIIAAFSRYSSLAALVAAVFAPFYQLLVWGGGPIAAAVTVMGGLLVLRHRANIQKLLKGTESKLGQKAAAPAQPTKHSHEHSPKHSHKHGAKP